MLVNIILAVIAFIGAILCADVKHDSNVRLVLQIINDVAPAAVVAAEKLGGASNVKFDKAVSYVEHALNQAGITKTDLTTIENAVEKQWAELSKTGTLDQYKKEVSNEKVSG